MKINPIKLASIQPFKFQNFSFGNVYFAQNIDCASFSNLASFDTSLFLKREIIKEGESLEQFFDRISSSIFKDNEEKKEKEEFLLRLKKGEITLSSSCYKNLSNPQSARAYELDFDNSISKNLLLLNESIFQGVGVGINFSKSKNPTQDILKINDYFKYIQEKSPNKRPPAGIALLNWDNSDILNFIRLKNNPNYDDWCFDLSIVLDDDFFQKLEKKDKNALAVYQTLVENMLNSGEPAVIFSNKKDYICDSCAASELKKGENLTLAHINLSKFKKEGNVDWQNFKKAARILTLATNKIDENHKIGLLGYQELLDKLNVEYSSPLALEILKKAIEEIQNSGSKVAISPTSTTSRFLKTSFSIEPKKNADYFKQIKTLSVAQKQIDEDGGHGQISNTIILKENATKKDVDDIIILSKKMGLKGVSVFKK